MRLLRPPDRLVVSPQPWHAFCFMFLVGRYNACSDTLMCMNGIIPPRAKERSNPMQIEISRRRFLQGSVALMILGGSALSGADIRTWAKAIASTVKAGNGITKQVPTLCEMCVNKCAAIAHVRDGIVQKTRSEPLFPEIKKYAVRPRRRGNSRPL